MKFVLTDKQMDYIDDRTRHLMIMGSAGSGKTIFACTKVIMYGLEYPGARIAVFRSTLPALRETAWREIRELLITLKIVFEENKTNGVITLDNGSTISFMPLDSDEKIRSLNIDFAYIEQCEEISQDIYDEVDLRIRHKISRDNWGQMLIVVQPSRKTHWLYHLYYELNANDPDYKKVHFSYLENPYLPEKQKRIYDNLEKTNPDRYRTHALGEWISDSKQIFTDNWSVGVDRNTFKYYTGGVDYGWNVESCFLLCGWYDDECYVLGEVYQTELTNSQFLAKINDLLHQHNLTFSDIDVTYADAASPDRIQSFNNAGLYTVPSVKDVNAKIETTRSTRIHVSKDCENLIRELPEYQWMKNRDGEILDKPLKKHDHAIDALCYTCYGVRGDLTTYSPDFSVDLDEVYIY